MSDVLAARLGSSLLAFAVQDIREIMERPCFHGWPAAPRGIVGLLPYRGQTVVTIDLGAFLVGTSEAPSAVEPPRKNRSEGHLVILEVNGLRLGVLIDSALEIVAGAQFSPLIPETFPFLAELKECLDATAPYREGVMLRLNSRALVEVLKKQPLQLPELGPTSPINTDAKEPSLAQPPGVTPRTVVKIRIGPEHFAIPIEQVSEMVTCPEIHPIPGAPEHLRGLGYHRGNLVRLVDARSRLGLEETRLHRQELVILRLRGMTTGLMVDEIDRVLEIPRGAETLCSDATWLRVLDIEQLDLAEPS